MIIGTIADPAIGGTFLTWTIHYLSGHASTFDWKSNQHVNLPTDPVTDINAHTFQSNHPYTLLEFNDCITSLTSNPPDSFHTIYFHDLTGSPISSFADTTTAINISADKLDHILLLYNLHPLYQTKFNRRYLNFDTQAEQHRNFIDTFFNDSKLVWDNLGLTNVWDEREFLALNIRPRDIISILPNFNQHIPHYSLDCFELFTTFDKTVGDLFSYLGLSIDTRNWENWLVVYNKWRNFHTDRILFVTYFDKIIESIINGYDMDLRKFKLDLLQEAALQHELIYKHNLTFKTWGLEKFPDNTRDLHLLLEPNIYHKVEDIYGMLKGTQ